jgi:lia operon protein LiaH
MMNIFNRFKQVVEADLHELVDNKEKKNPIALLNQYLRQCEAEVEKVKKLIERQYLLNNEFTKEYNETVTMFEKRRKQAEIAAKAGEESLHEFAVTEASQYEERASHISRIRGEAIEQLGELEKKYQHMNHKLKDMYVKRMEFMGKENIARANQRIDHVLKNENGHDSFSRFEDMEQYLERLGNRVDADYNRSTIDTRIAQLEKEMENKELQVN